MSRKISELGKYALISLHDTEHMIYCYMLYHSMNRWRLQGIAANGLGLQNVIMLSTLCATNGAQHKQCFAIPTCSFHPYTLYYSYQMASSAMP